MTILTILTLMVALFAAIIAFLAYISQLKTGELQKEIKIQQTAMTDLLNRSLFFQNQMDEYQKSIKIVLEQVLSLQTTMLELEKLSRHNRAREAEIKLKDIMTKIQVRIEAIVPVAEKFGNTQKFDENRLKWMEDFNGEMYGWAECISLLRNYGYAHLSEKVEKAFKNSRALFYQLVFPEKNWDLDLRNEYSVVDLKEEWDYLKSKDIPILHSQ